MIIPKFIKPGDKIGVTAPSRGMEKDVERVRFDSAARQLKERGYDVIFTDNVFAGNDRFARSSTACEKAKQLHSLVTDPSVGAIYSASGGDFLAEMLPYLDMDLIRRYPKWIQGFSDNTSLLYYITTKGDIATAYGANFGDFGMRPWHRSVECGIGILEGKRRIQESFDTYQDGFGEYVTGLEGYRADGKVYWKNICKEKDGKIDMHGRLIGGCLDVIMNLSGTKYDGTNEFIEKYKDDGVIWFLESFDLQFEQMMESLWKMKEMGWFEHTNGIIFGRPLFYRETDHSGAALPSYEDVLHERLDELDIPIIADADIGHKGPQFVMILGALARIESQHGKGTVTYY